MSEIVTEVLVLPDGMDLDDYERRTFAITVRWRGPRTDTKRGGYAIMHLNEHLSHRGKWRYEPEPFLQRHFRWDDLESALVTARSVVNTISVMGRTWAEFREQRGD